MPQLGRNNATGHQGDSVTRPDPATPVIVGVGQVVERNLADPASLSSPYALTAGAVRAALDDSGAGSGLAAAVDLLMAIRSFPDSNPMWPQPFGRSDNPPASIAARAGLAPSVLVYTEPGGDVPQIAVAEAARALHRGEVRAVVVCGGEALATAAAAMRAGIELDWSESPGGSFDDRAADLAQFVDGEALRHGLIGAPGLYALLDNARRLERGVAASDYLTELAELFAPLSAIAASNPYAMYPTRLDPASIADPSGSNGFVAWPYTRALCARDKVNQAAAVILTTVGAAAELDIDAARAVYPAATASGAEAPLWEREHLSRSVAMSKCYEHILESIEKRSSPVVALDLYSCFPIAVSAALDALGDRRPAGVPLTVTGGLPYFGGPGNSYSLHAIAETVMRLRAAPDGVGVVGANGGVLSKQAVGLYSREALFDADDLAGAATDLGGGVATTSGQDGPARLETWTVLHDRGVPTRAVALARSEADDRRCYAASTDAATMERLMSSESVPERIELSVTARGNEFRFP